MTVQDDGDQGDQNVKGLAGSDKKASELMEPGALVTADGVVLASFKQVDGWTEFSETDNSGFFFPFSLGKEYSGKEKTVRRILPEPGTETRSTDQDWVLKVDKTKVFTVTVEDKVILTLDFRYATYPEA